MADDVGKGMVSGAALVVGGGIAGMQAALDLADGGFRVYLCEQEPGIGGRMARLDKTFPTNDCSMCIMSPKLVEAGRHLGISILPGARLVKLGGEPGRFVARVSIRARGVDPEKCTACGDCEPVCPVRIPDGFDAGLAQRKAIYRLYPQAVPNAYAVDKRGPSPCRTACPAGVNTHAYTALIREGKYREAWSVIYRRLPLPGVLGRVCPHPCEDSCHREEFDGAVSLCRLKRFVADRVAADDPELLAPGSEVCSRDESVAVVGAGPAGLACAYFLRRYGVRVTVLEARSVAGGMMVAGIPSYRLPRDVLEREVDLIARTGVEFRYGVVLGRDIGLSDLRREFDAVFLGVGAGHSTSLGVPGEDLCGVMPGIGFLEQVNLGQPPAVGKRVVVIGGGNTAMDSARTALRLGAERVMVAYRRSEAEITALPEELVDARAEGIEFSFLSGPVEFVGGREVTAVRLVRNELGEPDASGRRRPVPIPGSEFEVAADTVLVAVGQRPDVDLGVDLERRRDGTLVVNEDLETSLGGVYAGGDVVTGPARVIDAIAAGNRAALAILSRLGIPLLPGDERAGPPEGDPAESPLKVDDLEGAPFSDLVRTPREEPVHADPSARRHGFDEVTGALTEEQAVAEASRCLDCGGCCECLECVAACGPEAIDHRYGDEVRELEVGAVILAPGYDLYQPTVPGEYGYGIYQNVMTSMEFERLLSASGPTGGHVVRPSDDQEPRKIAFIQCVGSRDRRTADWCSSVCCMHATKEAIIAQEHVPGLSTSIFYNDLRAFGKEFERYYQRAENEYGVRYIKCLPSTVTEKTSTGELAIRYRTEDGNIAEEAFDLVVLSVGLRPSSEGQCTARAIDVGLSDHGFARIGEFDPVTTSRPGVFVAGCFSEPKDIPETVIEASAAAGAAARLLAPARGTEVSEREYPPERDVSGEPPRIGVFVCHCGLNIASVVDVEAVARSAAELPGVVFADNFLYTCAQDSIARIKERISEHGLNRVIVASCTPRTHEPLFRETIREAGLNPYLFELANIREQASWVHQREPVAATAKARDLVAMAVARSRLLVPLSVPEFPVTRRALVVGGGVAGLSASLTIAEQGFEVDLVERSEVLGGLFSGIGPEPDGIEPALALAELVERVSGDHRITVHLEAEVTAVRGYVGNFNSTVRVGDHRIEIAHGAAVIATGGREAVPEQYGYGEDPRIVTLRQYEEGHGEDGGPLAFIQCVGSRDDDHPYCSRVCCTSAIKEAIRAKLDDPYRQVTIMFRDIRTYGFRESLYQRARELGVSFVRYDQRRPPVVAIGPERLTITVMDQALGEDLEFEASTLVLSAGIRPGDNGGLSQLFKVPLTAEGFFAEAHAKLRPNEFAVDGVFVCGLAHAPKFGREAIAQGLAAGHKAATLLSRDRLYGQAIIATVNERMCKGCGICIDVCPYEARSLDDKRRVAVVNEIMCQGCGACVVACPNGAAGQRGYERRQILAMLNEAVR